MITAILSLIFCLEAICDYNVWKAQIKDASIKKYDRAWHRTKFIMWSVVFAFIFLISRSWFIPIAAIICRLWFMQVYYNKLRDIHPAHLGDNFIDHHMKKIGPNTVLILKHALLISTFLYELTHYENTTEKVFRILLSH